MNDKNSNLDSLLCGFSDGGKMGVDPIGTFVSHSAGIKTFGGLGLQGESLDGVNYNSISYNGPKFVGLIAGVGLNVLMCGVPQVVEIVCNIKNYKKLNTKS